MKRALNYKEIREAVHGPHQQVRNINREVLDRIFSRRIEVRVNRFAVAEKAVPITFYGTDLQK
jgi:hypothetical protein